MTKVKLERSNLGGREKIMGEDTVRRGKCDIARKQ